jgi:hypothetical protein
MCGCWILATSRQSRASFCDIEGKVRSYVAGFSIVALTSLALTCAACSGSRSDEIASECISDRQCGSGSFCESGRCTTTDSESANVTGRVEGAPEGVVVESQEAAGIECTLRDGEGLVCELKPGGRVTLVAPEVEGHRFSGWSGDDACQGEEPVLTLQKVARDTTCTANYALRVRVSGEIAGEGGLGVLALSDSASAQCEAASCEVDVGETVVLAAPERDGYRIVGFEGEGCGERQGYRVTVVPEAADVTCTASYVESLTVRGQTQGLREEDAPKPASQVVAEALVEGALCEGQLCSIDPGASVRLTAPEISGYRFRGWTGDAPCLSTELVVQVDGVSTNVVCTADYVPRYEVKGLSEGTDATIASASENLFSVCDGPTCTVDRGESVTLLAGSVEGFRLKEWTGEGCEALSGASAIARDVASDLTCTAHYVEGVSVTGSLVNAEGEVEASSDSPGAECGRGSCAIDLDGTVTLIAPRLPGRTFVGWSGDEGCVGSDLTLVLSGVTKSTSCSATYAARFTVAAKAEPPRGGSVTATSSAPNASCVGGTRCEVDEGSAVVLTATPNANFRFTGWSGGGPCVGVTPRLDLKVTGGVTCSANFVARIKVSSSAMPAAGGTTSASQLSLTAECQRTTCTVDAGTNVLLTATPAEGYLFTRWSGCGGPLNPLLSQPTLLVIGPTTDEACVANFEKKTYPVAAVAGEGGRASVSAGLTPCPGGTCMVEHGGSATFTATADASHDFAGWTGCSISGNTVGRITAPVTCTATFKIKPVKLTGTVNAPFATVVASSSSPGRACASNACTVDYGGSVTLTVGAVDPEGYRFSNWISCPGARIDGRSLTVDALTSSYTCTANYTMIPRYTVQVRADGPGTVSCGLGGCTVYEGGTVGVSATPTRVEGTGGTDFKGWTCTGGQSVNAANQVENLQSNVTCTAKFETYPVTLI